MPLKIHKKYLERISVHERDNCVSTLVTYRINLAELSLAVLRLRRDHTAPRLPACSIPYPMPFDTAINQSTPFHLLITLIPLQAIT